MDIQHPATLAESRKAPLAVGCDDWLECPNRMTKEQRKQKREKRRFDNRWFRQCRKEYAEKQKTAVAVIEPEIIYTRPIPREPENPQVAMMRLMMKVLDRWAL